MEPTARATVARLGQLAQSFAARAEGINATVVEVYAIRRAQAAELARVAAEKVSGA